VVGNSFAEIADKCLEEAPGNNTFEEIAVKTFGKFAVEFAADIPG